MKSLSLILLIFVSSVVFGQVDIACIEIISPPDTVEVDSVYYPKAVFQNLGTTNETFIVTSEIDSSGSIIYAEIFVVNDLASTEIDTIEMSTFIPKGYCNDKFEITFSAILLNDINPLNNVLIKELKIYTNDKFVNVNSKAFSLGQNTQGNSGGVSWADLNNDGLLDLFLIHNNQNHLFMNKGNDNFSDNIADSLGLTTTSGLIRQNTVIADLDNDQDLDIISRSDIFLNNGNSTNPNFTTNDISISNFGGYIQGVSLFDMDKDSNLDIYVARDGSSTDLLFHSNGIVSPTNLLTFTEKGQQLNISYTNFDPREPWQRHSHTVTCADYNQDGWADIYVGHDNHSGQFNRMFRNDKLDNQGLQNPFSMVTGPSSPATNPPQADSIGAGFTSTWNSSFGDYNNDGLIDIFISTSNTIGTNEYNILYEHQINSPYPTIPDEFINVAQAKGVTGVMGNDSKEAFWGDFDNDGWLDLFVANPNSYPYSVIYKNYGNDYANQGVQTQFVQVHQNLFEQIGYPSENLSLADYNNDGLLDIFLSSKTSLGFLMRNGICSDNNWIQLDLVGTQSNVSAIGSQLKLYSGGMVQYRQVIGGTGRSMESLRVEFGLGQTTYIDSLVIDWPSGIHQTLYDGELTINSINEITEGICQPTFTSSPSQILFLNGVIGEVDSADVVISNNSDCFVQVKNVNGQFPYNAIMTANKTNFSIPPQSQDSIRVFYLHLFEDLSTFLEITYNDSQIFAIPVLTDTTTSIESEKSQLPTEFSLTQNYPNPFNPTTRIEFGIPQESNVQLQIFNIKGRLVKELVNSKLNAGFYNLDWNGTDKNGSKVSSGVYFYKLQTDEFSQTKKMILIK